MIILTWKRTKNLEIKYWATRGREKFDLGANAPCPVAILQSLEKAGILDMAQWGNTYFQQHAWGYFAFKSFTAVQRW